MATSGQRSGLRRSTKFCAPSSWQATLLAPLEADVAVERAVFVPFGIDLYVQKQVDFPPEVLGDGLARGLADLLQA